MRHPDSRAHLQSSTYIYLPACIRLSALLCITVIYIVDNPTHLIALFLWLAVPLGYTTITLRLEWKGALQWQLQLQWQWHGRQMQCNVKYGADGLKPVCRQTFCATNIALPFNQADKREK